jgi:hypothetical protein
MIRIVGPRSPKEPGLTKRPEFVDTTSRSPSDWQRDLSPFHLGPCRLYEGAVVPQSANMENAWQFAKVYRHHVGSRGFPTQEYFDWARDGWTHRRAVRYPMGKGAVPEYSWWDGERLGYVEARKRIYVPLYTRAVVGTRGFARLRERYRELGTLVLWDFDGYDHHALGMTLKEVMNDPTRKMGHAFVLAMILGELVERGSL